MEEVITIFSQLIKDFKVPVNSRDLFVQKLQPYFKHLKKSAIIIKIIIEALGERDENAAICNDKDGQVEPDSELRDYENVPYEMDINEYFEKEVKPYVPDAWINTSVKDHKDGKVGIVGYEIPFTRHFYKYEAPRSLEAIEADIEKVENELLNLLKQL
jgi:type I restriction enzyme M protein